MIYSHNSLNQISEQRSNINYEPDINIDLYSAGWFDGLMGLDAQLPQIKDYWDGYALGNDRILLRVDRSLYSY